VIFSAPMESRHRDLPAPHQNMQGHVCFTFPVQDFPNSGRCLIAWAISFAATGLWAPTAKTEWNTRFKAALSL